MLIKYTGKYVNIYFIMKITFSSMFSTGITRIAPVGVAKRNIDFARAFLEAVTLSKNRFSLVAGLRRKTEVCCRFY